MFWDLTLTALIAWAIAISILTLLGWLHHRADQAPTRDPYHRAQYRTARRAHHTWILATILTWIALYALAATLHGTTGYFLGAVFGYIVAKIADPHIDQARARMADARAWLDGDLDHYY